MASNFGMRADQPVPKNLRGSAEPIVRFFSYHDAHPVALGLVLMKEFSVEWLEWEAEALRASIIRAFRATSVSEQNWQKIQAFRAMMAVTSPWSEWEIFENVIQAFNNNVPDFEAVQKCTMCQLLAGVDIMNTVRVEDFQDEVVSYIAACAVEEGVMYLPPPLEFAQDKLSRPMYHCADCGTKDEVSHDDGRCDCCCGRFSDGRPLNGKANPRLPPEAGTNITHYLLRDPHEVEVRFNAIKELKTADLDEESPVDVQAAKLVVADRYRKQRAQELVDQLKELKKWVAH